MRFRQSVKYRLTIGFVLVMIPVIVYMLINNSNSRELVRTKVSETYSNTLNIFAGQIDHYLMQIDNYLYKMAVLDSDIGLLTSYPVDSNEYTLTKVRIDAKMNRDVGVYNLLNSVFLYQPDDIIFGTESLYGETHKLLAAHMAEQTELNKEMYQYDKTHWYIGESDRIVGKYFLINYIKISDSMYFGAIVSIADIQELLLIQWNDGEIGYSSIYRTEQGNIDTLLTDLPSIERTPTTPNKEQGVVQQLVTSELEEDDSLQEQQRIVEAITSGNEKDYVIMDQYSEEADIAYRLAIPEKTIMRELLFFRNATLVAPIFFLVVLGLYVLFMQRMLFKPLHELMLGMKKISLGNLGVRLKGNNTVEFDFLANTFNDMAEQVKNLKIDVYEEQLRVKQGELKQLQSQINPHFYMNSLNIIYNFAVLEEMESVKKMSLHLADYFRFIMTSNQEMITLREELKHIENYIVIQQLRFPNRLQMNIHDIEPFLDYPIAALTIQPFIENAIIHGFKNRKQLFQIDISAQSSSHSSFTISIADNGVGFSPEVLEKLQRREPIVDEQRRSLGIGNIIDRLELLYGSKASIQFYNKPDQGGAVVEITFPIVEE